VKGDPRCWRKGRTTGSKNRPTGTEPYRCPHCHKPIGKAYVRRALTLEQIPARLRQMRRIEKHRVSRRGSRGFERGLPDPARNLTGRLIGQQSRCPLVPPYCRHCKRRIVAEYARVMKKRWRRRNAGAHGNT